MSFSKIPQNANFDTNRKFSTEEISRLNSILECNLGPEFISKRPNGFGGPVSYIEGFKALNLANYVFGFNGWNSEIRSTTVDYVDDHGGNGRFSIGLSVVIRISLKDGTFHEDIGYGSVENAKGRPAAFEKAKKQAITDGMKRCLRCFGNVLGNCLYDKDYLKYIGKVKTPVPKFSEAKLLRHPDIKRLNKIKQLEDAEQNNCSTPSKYDTVTNTNSIAMSKNIDTTNHNTSVSKIRKDTNSKVNNTQAKYQQRQSINAKHGKILSNITNNVSTASGSVLGKNSPQTLMDDSDKPMTAIDAKKNTILTASLFDDSFDDNFGDEDDEFNDIDEYELELITNKITSSTNIQQPATSGQHKNPTDILNDLTPIHPEYNSDIVGATATAVSAIEASNSLMESGKSMLENKPNSNNDFSKLEDFKGNQIPSSVAFVSAKSAAVISNSGDGSNSNASIASINKPFKTNIKSRSVDHTKSTPIKRSMVDRHPVYPSSKCSATSNPNKRVNI